MRHAFLLTVFTSLTKYIGISLTLLNIFQIMVLSWFTIVIRRVVGMLDHMKRLRKTVVVNGMEMYGEQL